MSTSYKDIFDAVTARLQANWPTTPIHWPGTKFTPPKDAAWIQPRLVWGDAVQAAIGVDGENRITGILHINVFTPVGMGSDETTQHVDSLRALFPRGLRLAAGAKGIYFHPPRAEGPIEDEIWNQIPVMAPFWLDEEPS